MAEPQCQRRSTDLGPLSDNTAESLVGIVAYLPQSASLNIVKKSSWESNGVAPCAGTLLVNDPDLNLLTYNLIDPTDGLPAGQGPITKAKGATVTLR